MTNFDTARKALETSLGSEGSALEEHGKYAESLEFKLNSLKASWQSFAQTFMNSDFLKGGIDVLKVLLDLLEGLVDNFGVIGTIGLGVAGKNIFEYFKGIKEAKKILGDIAIETTEAVSNITSATTEATESISNIGSAATETAESVANITSATTEAAESMTNVTSSATEATEAITNIASASTEAAEAATNLASGGSEIVESVGNVASVVTDGAEAVGNMAVATTEAGEIAVKSAGGFKAFATSTAGIVTGIGLAVAAIALIINAINNYKEKQAEIRQENIETADSFLESARAFEQAYINYSGKTSLTSEEEAELESAINGTVEALGDKSSALQNVVDSSSDYLANLEAIKKAELDAANAAAKSKRDNAELELKEVAGTSLSSLFGVPQSKIAVEIPNETSEAGKIAQKVADSYYEDILVGGKHTKYQLDIGKDADISEIVDYYYTLLEYQKQLSEADLIDTAEYTNVTTAIEKMSEAIAAYESGVSDAAKAQYQLTNGIPKTTEEYLKMRESILNQVGGTLETKKKIAGQLDSEYGQMFDLSTAEAQSKKLIGILDGYGSDQAKTVETFLNMRTKVNNKECSVGDYISQFDNITAMTEGWSDAAKEEFNASFGIDTDTIKKQYDDLLSDLTVNIGEESAKEFLNGLTVDEFSAAFSLKGEVDWKTVDIDKFIKQIEEEAKLNEAISFNVDLKLETKQLEDLNAAITQSLSGSGLGIDSEGNSVVSAVESMFAGLDSYDPSKLFERTANGIRLNSDEIRRLNDEYKQTNIKGLNDKMSALGDKYNKTREELSNLTYGTDEYNQKARELSDIEAQINATETLASQYEGLASAYNTWQMAESAGSQRDMYESMLQGLENVDDEISRGWLDDGTIEFLRLIKGENLSATATTKELKKAYESLDDTIKHTTYSVRDFFTVDEDGNSTNDGVYNFLDAIGQMEEEKFGGKDVVKRDKKGNIIGFDFQVAGGDKAIADALGISEELVQIMVRAADDAGFVVSMDGTYQQLDVLKEKAQDAANKLKEIGATKFQFDLNTGDEGSVLEQYGEALKIWDTFKKNKNADGTVNMDVKGAQDAFTLVSTLQTMVDRLGEPVYMKLDATQVEKDMKTPLSKLQEYERLVQTENQLKLKGTDTSEIDKAQEEIINYFEGLSPEIKAQLGIDKLTKEELQQKIEAGEIEIPATIDLQVEMNNSLRDMVNIALYNAGLIDGEELEKRIDISLYAGEVDTTDVDTEIDRIVDESELDADKKVTIKAFAEVFGVEDIDDLSKKLEVLDDEQVQVLATVLGKVDVDKLKTTIDGLDDKTVQAIAKALGEGDVDGLKTTINGLDDKTVQAIAQALGYSDVDQLNTAIENLDPKTVQAIAEALGIKDVDSLRGAINRLSNKNVKAVANVNGKDKVDGLKSSIDNLKGKTITIWAQIKKKASELWDKLTGGGGVDGTAHVNGTAYANGTAKSGRAFKQGDWGTKDSGVALGGEEAPELLVRNGKWHLIGERGAEFFGYRKGDIIFNASQTKEIFEKGKITHGNGRGKALVSGTAFKEGSLGNEGLGKANTGKPVKGTSSSKKNNSSSDADKFEETLDFVEIAISRIERAIDQLDKKANSVYKTWSERNKALTNEISKVGDEIELQQSAYNRYMQQANSVGLSSSWAAKVRSGSFDISTVTDEALAEKIKDYQTWYEKALACQDAIEDLKEKELDLYKQRFDNVQSQYDGILQGYEHTETMLNEYIAQSEAQGHIVSTKYYDALIDNEKKSIAELQKEQIALIEKRNEAVANGVSRDSQDFLDMCAEIDAVTQSIEEGTTAIIEYNNAIRDIEWQQFDLIQERISDITAESEFLIELMSNKKLFDDNGKFTEQGTATVGLHALNYNTSMYAADEYAKEIAKLDAQIAKDPYDQELINRRRELVELQRESILAAEGEKDAIRDLVEEGINLELDALQERINLHNEELDSMKDLYDYQKRVKEQTEEIASLEKQMAAYSNDDSEEAKAKIQELKVSLEEANADLEETEYDKYISDQSALLDELYLEYETILNSRLDNIDALLEQVIAEIDIAAGAEGAIVTALGSEGALVGILGSNATTIKDTLVSETSKVGTTLSNAMNDIWSVGDGNAKSVLTMYGQGFQDKQTTTNTVLGNIKADIHAMVDDIDKDAKKKVEAPKTTTSAKKDPVKTTTTTKPATKPTTNTSGGDGKPKVGDKVKFVSGKYYYDSEGKKPLGSQNLGKQVYITKINTKSWATHPYHISTGNKLGKGDLGWLKLNQISGYATGKKKIPNSQYAWTQENNTEFIVRPSDGAILTPVAKGDSILNAKATGNIWNFANNPTEFIKDNLGLDSASVPNSANVNNTYTQHIDKVVFDMENVKNYEEMLSAMRKDKNFERLILSMSIDRIAGKSGLAKNKSIR